jgi:hypothetical protein
MRSAIRIMPWARGADPVSITAGDGGTYPLASVGEGSSVGSVPIDPDLVERIAVTRKTRKVRSRSNHVAGSGLASGHRLSMTLKWTGLSKAQRDTLMTFLDTTIGQTASPFDIAPDGPSSASEERLKVRLRARATDTLDAKGAYGVMAEVEECY